MKGVLLLIALSLYAQGLEAGPRGRRPVFGLRPFCVGDMEIRPEEKESPTQLGIFESLQTSLQTVKKSSDLVMLIPEIRKSNIPREELIELIVQTPLMQAIDAAIPRHLRKSAEKEEVGFARFVPSKSEKGAPAYSIREVVVRFVDEIFTLSKARINDPRILEWYKPFDAIGKDPRKFETTRNLFRAIGRSVKSGDKLAEFVYILRLAEFSEFQIASILNKSSKTFSNQHFLQVRDITRLVRFLDKRGLQTKEEVASGVREFFPAFRNGLIDMASTSLFQVEAPLGPQMSLFDPDAKRETGHSDIIEDLPVIETSADVPQLLQKPSSVGETLWQINERLRMGTVVRATLRLPQNEPFMHEASGFVWDPRPNDTFDSQVRKVLITGIAYNLNGDIELIRFHDLSRKPLFKDRTGVLMPSMQHRMSLDPAYFK